MADMIQWVRDNRLPAVFLITLVLGLLLLSAGLFTISCTAGLIGTGLIVIGAGHWVTYLKTAGGRA